MNYVDNKELYLEIKKYKIQKLKDKNHQIPKSLIKKIKLIATNLSYRKNFINYTFKDEMIGEAIYTCVRYLDKFDYKNYKNPLGYITTIVWRSYQKIINEEKKAFNVKQKHWENLIHSNIIDGDKRHKMLTKNYVKNIPEDKEFSPLKIIYNNQEKIFNTEQEWFEHCKN